MNMSIGFITCRDEHKERMIPFGHAAREALTKYLEAARETFFKGNTLGASVYKLQRQGNEPSGLWKIIKYYGTVQESRKISHLTPCAIPLRHIF